MPFQNDKRLVAPCVAACPAEVDVPRYIGYVAEGRFSEAHATVREAIPLPMVCGLICYRPCEPWCRRGIMEEPIAINAIKRAAVDHGDDEVWRKQVNRYVAAPTGKGVAIVGSGPAGLTAAYYLSSRRGHEVTLFEGLPRLGGMLVAGLPEYKVPRDLLEREIEQICAKRVDARVGTWVESIEDLAKDYDAVLLAVGQTRSSSRGPSVEKEGIEVAANFLREANLGQRRQTPGCVVVVGGNNVAMDAARMALRLGSKKVIVLIPSDRSMAEAHDHEVADAEAEGVEVISMVRPSAIDRVDGAFEVSVEGLEVVSKEKMQWDTPDVTNGSHRVITAGAVLVSTVREADVPGSWGVEMGKRGGIRTGPDSQMTSRDGVFAAGDAVTGRGTIVDALDQGKRAAIAIDQFLGGEGDISENFTPAPSSEMELRADIAAQGKSAVPMSLAEAARRKTTFEIVEQGYSKAEAIAEARRCIRCDLWRIGTPDVWEKQQD